MAVKSAGVLLYRKNNNQLEVFLVHPGGPFWARKDDGAWSLPKGQFEEGEDPVIAAQREFKEETGHEPPNGEYRPIGSVRLKSGKTIYGWAVEGSVDEKNIKSISMEIEWPPKSGKKREFPEVDRAGWFTIQEARIKIHEGQSGFLGELEKLNP